MMNEIQKLLERRHAAIKTLDAALAHKSRQEIIAIITSFISVEELEKIARFQDR